MTTSALDVELATFGARWIAWFADLLLSWGVLVVAVVVAVFLSAGTGASSVGEAAALLALPFGWLFVLLYHTLFRGETPGKRMAGIAVRSAFTGRRMGYGRAFLRALVTFVLWVLFYLPGIIDGLSALWDPRRQTWHDKAVDTIVVRVPRARAATP